MRYTHRIRPCAGNKRCWCLIKLRANGSEINSYGGYTTSTSLDLLLRYAGHLKPVAGDRVDFVPMEG